MHTSEWFVLLCVLYASNAEHSFNCLRVCVSVCPHKLNKNSVVAEMTAQSCTVWTCIVKCTVPQFSALFLSNLKEYHQKSCRGLLPKARFYGQHFCHRQLSVTVTTVM